MMQLCVLVAVIVVYLGGNGIVSYPTGAPESACVSLTPDPSLKRHQGPAQSSPSPYRLQVDGDNLAPGTNVTVSVVSSDSNTRLKLKGILLQARKCDGAADGMDNCDVIIPGTFTNLPSHFKFLECSTNRTNASVTHSDSSEKSLPLTFSWTAPKDFVGEVQFLASFVQKRDTYWTRVASNSVIYAVSSSYIAGHPHSNTASQVYSSYSVLLSSLAVGVWFRTFSDISSRST